MLSARPLLKAAATSTLTMGLGDVACQLLQQRGQPAKRPVDWTRTARMAFMGGTLHGPFFFKGMRLLDQRFGNERTLRTAALKSAVGQMTLFPSYTAIFFLYAGILEGATLQASADKLVAAFPTACASGTLYWPVVNLITFQLPPSSRLAFLGTAGVAWNGLLSFLAARPNKP